MRRMSFALTPAQARAKRKIVTRRFGWWDIHPGDEHAMVEKAMGFAKGAHAPAPFDTMIVLSARVERVDAVDEADVLREGFPSLTPAEFVAMLCQHGKRRPSDRVNRIAFVYGSDVHGCAEGPGNLWRCGYRAHDGLGYVDHLAYHFNLIDAELRRAKLAAGQGAP